MVRIQELNENGIDVVIQVVHTRLTALTVLNLLKIDNTVLLIYFLVS